MAIIPTVRIKHGERGKIINECDFDPAKHELFDAPAKPQPAKRGRKKKG
jgi:hypothetical protein